MFKRFRWRLMTTYIVLVIFSMLVLGFCLLNSLEDYFYSNLQTRLETQAKLACRLVNAGFDWNRENMEELADKISADIKARVTIIDRGGTVLGDSERDARDMENHLDRPEVIEAKSRGVGMAVRHSTTLDTGMMYVAVPVTRNGTTAGFMRLALPLAETRQAFSRLWSVALGAIMLAVFVTAAVSLALSKRVTEPVEKLSALARRMSRGDFRGRAEVTSSDEIGELAGTLNQMAETIEDKVRQVSEEKNKLEAVLASMISGVVIINGKGRVELVNPAAEKYFSFPGSGLPYDASLKHPELSAAIKTALESGQVVEREIKMAAPKETTLQVVISPVLDHTGNLAGVVAVLHDITEIRKLEKVRSEFVANVSHELKTPVTAVKGFTETLLDGAMHDPETCREFVEIIDNEAGRLKRLIHDLLELSRIEAKQVKLKLKPENVSSLVRDTALKLQGQAENAGLTIELRLPAGPVMARLDRDMIEQVMVNLVDNAIKYTPAGGRIEIEVEEKQRDAVVWVRDTGIGIPPEDIDRVFERFYRVDKTRSRLQGGTGLGLSIVKHIVDIHGGTVGVESKPGKGSAFFFTLPKEKRQ